MLTPLPYLFFASYSYPALSFLSSPFTLISLQTSPLLSPPLQFRLSFLFVPPSLHYSLLFSSLPSLALPFISSPHLHLPTSSFLFPSFLSPTLPTHLPPLPPSFLFPSLRYQHTLHSASLLSSPFCFNPSLPCPSSSLSLAPFLSSHPQHPSSYKLSANKKNTDPLSRQLKMKIPYTT